LKIYMDACCYNRPMDDQNQDRIYIESEVIKSILLKCEQGVIKLLGSNVIEYELNNNPNIDKKNKSLVLYNCINENYSLTDEITKLANEFEKNGIKALDSLHLAMAESSGADVLLTVDDGFIKLSSKVNTKVKVINPVKWMMEV